MHRLLLTEEMTADGRIEVLDGWFDPSPDGDIQDWLEVMDHWGGPPTRYWWAGSSTLPAATSPPAEARGRSPRRAGVTVVTDAATLIAARR